MSVAFFKPREVSCLKIDELTKGNLTMTIFHSIIYSKKEGVATIALNRPNAANGLNTEMAEELALAAADISADSDIKAVILTASGRFFCAGGDIKAIAAFGDDVKAGIKHLADELHKALSLFARMDAPLIVAVNGMAAGAGFSMAVCGDLILATESAKFTMAYSKAGLSPDGSSSYYLPRIVGLRRAQELMFTNRVLSAEEALDWGAITAVVSDEALLVEADKMAQMFVSGSRGANSAIKKLLLQTWSDSLETQMELEGEIIAENAESIDGREGVAAFLGKRQPEFE